MPATREERIDERMRQLRPKVEEALRLMVERAVDVPEHEEFGSRLATSWSRCLIFPDFSKAPAVPVPGGAPSFA